MEDIFPGGRYKFTLTLIWNNWIFGGVVSNLKKFWKKSVKNLIKLL